MRAWFIKCLLGPIAFGAIAGCAVNDVGTVRVDRYENEYGYFVRTRAIGISLVTVPSDEGIVIGYADRGYFIPKPVPGQTAAAPPAALSPGMARGLPMARAADATLRLHRLGTPVAVRGFDAGLSVRLNPARAGVTLGTSSSARLRLEPDREAVLALSYDSDQADAPRFFFKEGLQ